MREPIPHDKLAPGHLNRIAATAARFGVPLHEVKVYRSVPVEQDAPCVMCLTDSGDPCTCVGYCGIIVCHGDFDA